MLILNNDTILSKTFFYDLQNSINDNLKNNLTIFSPLIKTWPGKNIWYSGGRINIIKSMGEHYINRPDKKIINTDFISGCCMICKPSSFYKLSGFDEKFFLYYEDVDLSIRAKIKGYELYVIPELIIYHKVGSSTGGDKSEIVAFYSSRNRIYLMRKHYGGFILYRFYCFFLLNRIFKITTAIFLGNYSIAKYLIKGIRKGFTVEI